jgi:hypothetical protein
MEQTATKRCSKCGATKATTEFHVCKHASYGVSSSCKVCARATATEFYRADPKKGQANAKKWREADPERYRAGKLARQYGLGIEDYERMLNEQGGTCAICQRPNKSGIRLAVDHDHTTGAVRQLLCSPCNTALGLMQDNSDRLRTAAAYLDRHRSAD